MKRIILILIVFFNILPYIQKGKIQICGLTANAQLGMIGAGNGLTTAPGHGPTSGVTGWTYVGASSGHGHHHGGGGGDEIGEENGDYDIPDGGGWDEPDDDYDWGDDGGIFSPAGSGGQVVTTDCAGVRGGTAFIDKCGICVWGTTGLTPCLPPGYYLTVNSDPTKYYSNAKIYIPLSNIETNFHLVLHYDNGPLDPSVIDWYFDGNLTVSQSLSCDIPDLENSKYVIEIAKSGELISYNVMDVYGAIPCSYITGAYVDNCGTCITPGNECAWGYEDLTPGFQYTNHEVDVWNQIYAEDALTESTTPSPCHGTLRSGNVRWPGTLAHWIIMMDWIWRDHTNHDIEYYIPNSGPSGGAGYADLVNTTQKMVYEIKPRNASGTGLAQGQVEVANYVAKANLSCGPTWTRGIYFGTRYLPSGNPLKVLKAEQVVSGVVLYEYIDLPNPGPVAIPVSTLDKIKHLVKRIKDHIQDSERIITEFLRENPDLVTYFKTAAIGAAVALVVGTIAEDIATAGSGILDDWASIKLAYDIVRYAWAL